MGKFKLSWVLAFFLCVLTSFVSVAQGRNLTGTVRDDKGSPLVGATVIIKESNTSATTDANGHFSIAVPSNGRTLVISFVGMQSQERAIGNATDVSISLASATATLSDVVV